MCLHVVYDKVHVVSYYLKSRKQSLSLGWWRGVVVTLLIRSAKLLYAGPG